MYASCKVVLQFRVTDYFLLKLSHKARKLIILSLPPHIPYLTSPLGSPLQDFSLLVKIRKKDPKVDNLATIFWMGSDFFAVLIRGQVIF